MTVHLIGVLPITPYMHGWPEKNKPYFTSHITQLFVQHKPQRFVANIFGHAPQHNIHNHRPHTEWGHQQCDESIIDGKHHSQNNFQQNDDHERCMSNFSVQCQRTGRCPFDAHVFAVPFVDQCRKNECHR